MSIGDITEQIRIICEGLVRKHLPHEADLFDVVWDAVWQSYGCASIEAMRSDLAWRRYDQPIAALGAIGDQQSQVLDTLYVIGGLVEATVQLLRDTPYDELQFEDVVRAVSAGASRTNAPQHVCRILERFGTVLLANQLAIAVPEEASTTNASAAQASFSVDWYDSLATDHEDPEIAHGVFDLDEVKERFDANRERYVLYVDETRPFVDVRTLTRKRRPAKKPHRIYWPTLEARHRLFLGMVLNAFRTRQRIRYQTVAREVLGDRFATAVDRDGISRVKSDLDRLLQGVLKNIVKAQKNLEYFEIRGQIPYCWIRPSGGVSILTR
ncbi:MAG: hypothetical protein IID41_03715 [Planctomycetes bacterium]|nr:hypothetical protein [Planctomycetota bacterium]